MPSKLRKAIGAVKDQTSIGIAKVSNNASSLDVAVLKTTSHDEVPLDDRYVNEVLQLISTNKAYAAACAQAIAKRIGRTRNWIVALKSLMLVLRIFQDGDPYFPRDVLHVMKRGARILNLTNFRDDSNSSPWDYTAFVRTFALYLDERLDCFLTGKLQRRFARDETEKRHGGRKLNPPVRDMKPGMLIDRITNWQRLLDRAVATRPTGPAKTNKLVQVTLYAVVQESFDLYRDISDGLALLLDSFFHLQYQSCVNAFQACVKASKQFEELSGFYSLCKSIGVGRTSEYPSVQKISDELIETLQEFLKDQAPFPSNGRAPASHLLLPAPPKNAGASSEHGEADQLEVSEPTERFSGYSTSLEDLVSVVDLGMSPSIFADQEGGFEPSEKQSLQGDFANFYDNGSVPSLSVEQRSYSAPDDLVSFYEDWPEQPKEEEKEKEKEASSSAEADLWEIVLVETANQVTQPSHDLSNSFQNPSPMDDFFNQTAVPDQNTNPFLQDLDETPVIAAATTTSFFPMSPTFHATPTFSAQNLNDTEVAVQDSDDPFAAYPTAMSNEQIFNGLDNQQNVLHEQKLWLEQQNKIIAKVHSLDS